MLRIITAPEPSGSVIYTSFPPPISMKVAIVGSGVSGLSSAWALNEYSEHEVHVYEADERAGGHANTVKFTSPTTGESTMVDMGFIVFNPPTYPNFLRFLRILNIPASPTTMSFSVTRDKGAFEYGGENLVSLFCQFSNLFKSSMWRMIWDILRFNASARRLLAESESAVLDSKVADAKATSLGAYLKANGYSDSFRDDYLLVRHLSYQIGICLISFEAHCHLYLVDTSQRMCRWLLRAIDPSLHA